jgi:hypothetical protein
MSYVLSGRIQARCSADTIEPVSQETVQLYWIPEGEPSTFTVRSHEETRAREYLLLAQGRTDAEGRFRIVVDGGTIHSHRGSARRYAGEPLGLEVYYRGEGSREEPAQFSMGHIQPRWDGDLEERVAEVEHEIAPEQWSLVRAAVDLWTITGTLRRSDGSPAAAHRVSAFDADVLRDDFLGSAESGPDGRFRIDYPGARFRPAPIGGIDLERGGPEIYFHVEAPDGSRVYEEPSDRGKQSDRRNAPNWFTTELTIEAAAAPEVPEPAPPTPV